MAYSLADVCHAAATGLTYKAPPIVVRYAQPIARSCVTCQETQCFRRQPALAGEITKGSCEAWLLDAWTPEFAR